MLALFKKPEDVIEFMNHHERVYVPLVKKIPGLSNLVINQVKADSFGGAPTYFMITEMHFPDKAVFRVAMESRENQLAGRELMGFAKGYVTLLVTEIEEPAKVPPPVGRHTVAA